MQLVASHMPIRLNTSTSVTGAARGIIVVPEDDNLTKVYMQLTNRMHTHHRSTVLLTSILNFD